MFGRILQGGDFLGVESSVLRPVFLNICGDQRAPLRHGDLPGDEAALPATDSQPALTNRPQVPGPVGIAAWRNEISLALVIQWQHGHGVATAGGAPADGEGWGQPERCQQRIHDLVVEEARLPVGSGGAHASACSNSASRSSGCSSPTEQRTSPSAMPARARSPASSPRCEVEAGWLSVVATLPRLGISRTNRSRWTIASSAGLPAASSNDSSAPAPHGSSRRARSAYGLASSCG